MTVNYGAAQPTCTAMLDQWLFKMRPLYLHGRLDRDICLLVLTLH